MYTSCTSVSQHVLTLSTICITVLLVCIHYFPLWRLLTQIDGILQPMYSSVWQRWQEDDEVWRFHPVLCDATVADGKFQKNGHEQKWNRNHQLWTGNLHSFFHLRIAIMLTHVAHPTCTSSIVGEPHWARSRPQTPNANSVEIWEAAQTLPSIHRFIRTSLNS